MMWLRSFSTLMQTLILLQISHLATDTEDSTRCFCTWTTGGSLCVESQPHSDSVSPRSDSTRCLASVLLCGGKKALLCFHGASPSHHSLAVDFWPKRPWYSSLRASSLIELWSNGAMKLTSLLWMWKRTLRPLLALVSTFFLILLRNFWMASHCLPIATWSLGSAVLVFRSINSLSSWW